MMILIKEKGMFYAWFITPAILITRENHFYISSTQHEQSSSRMLFCLIVSAFAALLFFETVKLLA